MKFESFDALADEIDRRTVALPAAVREAAAAAGALAVEASKKMIGHYQPAVGDLPAWAPLTDATKADRTAKGFTPDDPLLRSGELRDAVEFKPAVDGVGIGVFGDSRLATIARAMEYGYYNVRAGRFVAPRSYIRGAVYVTLPAMIKEISGRVFAVLSGKV